jgi:hypothetical protein
MRFMLIIRADEAGIPLAQAPTMDDVISDMVEAGVLLVVEGLQPAGAGARITFPGGRPTVTEGAHPDSRISGFLLIQVHSRAEAIAWAKRCFTPGAEVEMRPVHEALSAEFAPERIRAVA